MQSSRSISDSLKKMRRFHMQIRYVSAYTLKKSVSEYTDMKIASSVDLERNKWLEEFKKIIPFLFVSCAPDRATKESLAKAKNVLLNKFLVQAPREMLQKNVDVFNTVLFGLAEFPGGNVELKKLVDVMKENNIKPNLRTISACLLSANYNAVDGDEINEILKWAHDSKVKLEYILLNRVNGEEDTKKILRTIRLVDNNFSPVSLDFLTEYGRRFNLLPSLKEPSSTYVDDGPYANIPGLSKEKLMENVRKQLKLEFEDKVIISSIVKPKPEKKDFVKNRLEFEKLTDSWRASLNKAFDKKLSEMNIEKPNSVDRYLASFLTCVDADDVVQIMLDCAIKLSMESENFSPPVATIKHNLGRKIFQFFDNNLQSRQKMDQKILRIYEKYVQFFTDPSIARENNQRKFWIDSAKRISPEQIDVKVFVATWGYENFMKLGQVLFDLIMNNVKYVSPTKGERRVFYVIHFGSGKKLREEVRVDRQFSSTVGEKTAAAPLIMDVQECPMICPPIPWHGTNSGYHGYFSFKQIIMVRTPGEYMKYSRKVIDQLKKYKYNTYQQLFPAMDSLNQLGAIPWKINVDVLNVAVDLFQNENVKRQYKELDLPLDPSLMIENPLPEDATRRDIRKAKREFNKKRKETNSLFATVLYRLSLASHFRDDVLWFPHNFDFRGRVYPVPPHLNHMGDDLCRGILLFAKGRKLGKDGLNWLKIHCINLTGIKKNDSIADRLKYANEPAVLDLICSSADDPINTEWWKTFEKPWQILACCIEIRNALEFKDGAENYLCRYPIHQDGCCNGLQHYAALGRDELGAKQVNLVESEKPKDVYTSVLELVAKQVNIDAESQGKNAELAKRVQPILIRKTIKQTVMTICYGVTMYGAKLQIQKQLKDKMSNKDAKEAASYLAKITFKSIGELFNNSRKIQKWLEKSAGLLSGECKQPVMWLTPLGFPVFQPYFRRAASKKSKPLRTVNGKEFYPNVEVPVKAKQSQAFPPNFVHSLDSTHMMMTALNCQHRGITYASVHDCYWTHPDTVAEMNQICREQFVHLYNQTILEDLSEQFTEIFDKWLDKNSTCKLNYTPKDNVEMIGSDINQLTPDFVAANDENQIVAEDRDDRPVERRSLIKPYTESEIYIRNIFTTHPRKGDFNLDLVKNSTYFFS